MFLAAMQDGRASYGFLQLMNEGASIRKTGFHKFGSLLGPWINSHSRRITNSSAKDGIDIHSLWLDQSDLPTSENAHLGHRVVTHLLGWMQSGTYK